MKYEHLCAIYPAARCYNLINNCSGHRRRGGIHRITRFSSAAGRFSDDLCPGKFVRSQRADHGVVLLRLVNERFADERLQLDRRS